MTGILNVLLAAKAAAAGGPAVTWDPTHTVSPIALTNSNLTAGITLPDANNYMTWATTGVPASSKKYWEINCDTTPAFANSLGFGFVDGSFVAGSGNFLGFDTHGYGYYGSGGDVYYSGGSLTTWQTYATTDIISFAVDTVNNKFWTRRDGLNWNNDVIGNQNPATNTGGQTFTMTPPFYPALVFRSDATHIYQVTGVFTSASWTYAAPSGFTQL